MATLYNDNLPTKEETLNLMLYSVETPITSTSTSSGWVGPFNIPKIGGIVAAGGIASNAKTTGIIFSETLPNYSFFIVINLPGSFTTDTTYTLKISQDGGTTYKIYTLQLSAYATYMVCIYNPMNNPNYGLLQII